MRNGRSLKPIEPIIVVDLFPEILGELLELLSGLTDEEWCWPTACPSWSVKDIVQHLLGDDISILSRKRDAYSPFGGKLEGWDDLVALINEHNEAWVRATRGISPRLLRDLLRHTGAQVCEYFRSRDPTIIGDPVSWAGPYPAPVWLDLAREYTERWLHQQHIREAVARPGLKQVRFFAPVLDAFARALPHTYRDVHRPDGTGIVLTISGEAGGRWSMLRENGRWNLYRGVPQPPYTEVVIDQDVAWRLFTKGVSRTEAQTLVSLFGDWELGSVVPDMVSIIA